MRICPTCHRRYEDETLSFCRDDGVKLVQISNDEANTLSLPKPIEHRLTTTSLTVSSHCEKNICRITLEDNWLDENGELPLCLAQPARVTYDDVVKDQSRQDSLLLAKAIFAIENDSPNLERWLGWKRGLLVFPEYAFGSADFEVLDDLVRNYPRPLIVLAGFGLASGVSLAALLKTCSHTWEKGLKFIDPQARYNAGWCWIHNGPSNTRCHIFLKNFLEQRIEPALPIPPTTGDHILQIVARDLILYPLICADLLCELPNSPRSRIQQSIPPDNGVFPEDSKRVLVAALLNTQQPYHGLWPPAINHIVGLQNSRAGLITVNQPADIQGKAGDDRWRCLSGGFISRRIMTQGPNPVLPSVSYVQTDSAAGLILRQSIIGIAAGSFRWTNSTTGGRNVWAPNWRRSFTADKLTELNESVESQEFKRYVRRQKAKICLRYPQSGPIVSPPLEQIVNEMDEEMLAPRLWTKLLTGVEESPAKLDLENMDQYDDDLHRSLGVLASIQSASGVIAIKGQLHNGQLLWKDSRNNSFEVLVWKSPHHPSFRMVKELEKSALKHPLEKLLIVIGEGNGGSVGPRKVYPSRFADISSSREAGNIANARVRHIEWRQLPDFENILNESDTSVEKKRKSINSLMSVN